MGEGITAAASIGSSAPEPAGRGELRFATGEERAAWPFCWRNATWSLAAYPAEPKSIFTGATTMWCGYCGSGYVPDADGLLDGYYACAYAESGRSDRFIEPERYFASLTETRSPTAYFAHRSLSHLLLLRRLGAVFDDVLDFGSGPGAFLHLSDARRKVAVEPDEYCAQHLAYIGAEVVNETDLAQESLDVIAASHVIEHLTTTTLHHTLARLYRALRVGGLILIEVPNGGLSHLILPGMHEPHALFFTPQGAERAFTRQHVRIEFKRPQGPADVGRPNKAAIYRPDPGDLFRSTAHGSILMILRKTARFRKSPSG